MELTQKAKQKAMNIAAGVLFERPVRKQPYQKLAKSLIESGQIIMERLNKAEDTSENRNIVRHVIGIERWGQQRIKVALGEPMLDDEYDEYQPDETLSLANLQIAFQITRQDTVGIVTRLIEKEVDSQVTVFHNNFGELSMKGWLKYLQGHAHFECKRIKETQEV